MTKLNPIILLDVMVENLLEFLENKDWKVEIVSQKLGITQQNRDNPTLGRSRLERPNLKKKWAKL